MKIKNLSIRKNHFLLISRIIATIIAVSVEFFHFQIIWHNDYIFMGKLLSLGDYLFFESIFVALLIISFYLMWKNKLIGYPVLAYSLFIQTILFHSTWFMAWPCRTCPVLQ